MRASVARSPAIVDGHFVIDKFMGRPWRIGNICPHPSFLPPHPFMVMASALPIPEEPAPKRFTESAIIPLEQSHQRCSNGAWLTWPLMPRVSGWKPTFRFCFNLGTDIQPVPSCGFPIAWSRRMHRSHHPISSAKGAPSHPIMPGSADTGANLFSKGDNQCRHL